MKLIVGLGNPGEQYIGTRHNLGFKVLDEMVKDGWEESKKFKSLIAEKDHVIFIKPQTYVNNSGMAVKLLTTYYKLPTTDVIIVYDELDLPLGKIKVRVGGASAGHHGIESIMEHLGTDQFTRIRLGIGPCMGPAEKFVLEEFKPQERQHVKHMMKQATRDIDISLHSL